MRPSLIAALILTAPLVGCAFGPPTVSPAEGGAPWRELRSSHFVVRTDAEEGDALEALTDLETTYSALEDVAFPEIASAPPPMSVVLFQGDEALKEFIPAGSAGAFVSRLPHDLEAEPTMIMPVRLGARCRITFTHELTHAFIRRAYGAVPIWLNEGLAQYFSTMRIEEGRVVLGSPIPGLRVPSSMLPSAEAILHADAKTFYAASYADADPIDAARQQTRYYAGAWFLVHMLMNGPDTYRARFQSFIHATNGGKRLEDAWQQEVGRASPTLAEDFADYSRSEELSFMAFATKVARGRGISSSTRIMRDEEVHLLWARLVPWEGATLTRAVGDIAAAEARAPDAAPVVYLRALFELERGNHPEAARLLRTALVRTPDDPRLLLALAATLARTAQHDPRSTASAEIGPVVDRLSKVATSVEQRTVVARYLGEKGRPEEGLEMIGRALAAEPSAWRAHDVQAGLLFKLGRAEEAARAEERAIAFLPEQASAKGRDLAKALARYRAGRPPDGHR